LANKIYRHIGDTALHSTLKLFGIDDKRNQHTCQGCVLAKAKAKPVLKLFTVNDIKPGEQQRVEISVPDAYRDNISSTALDN
jgi:hypothetical protein